MRFVLWLLPSLLVAQTYDIVLQRGRVMDPESGLDAVRSVGITGNKIVAVSTRRLRGKVEIDTTGLVVAPGFIDLHQHGQNAENYRYKAMDGVTTALELEVGASPVNEWYAALDGKALINFGASAGPFRARTTVMRAPDQEATPEEQRSIERAVKEDLDAGALGVGLFIEGAPKMTREEVLNLFDISARAKRPVFVHLRKPGREAIASLQEVIADAAATGASLHVMHVSGTASKRTPEALRMVEGARARGLDVSVEVYPYIAGGAPITSALFDPGWQELRGITYSDLLWIATGERLTQESFERYRKQGGQVVMFLNTEETVRNAIAHPLVMIASDGGLTNGLGHPRSAGTYARVLGKYVREDKALSLMDAIRKSSLMPARRLESMSPQMRQKGRLKVGADADISVFDAVHVIDKATFENPAQYSEGFRFVMVGGTFVIRDGKLQEGVAPGQAIRAQ
jgi:N-acyl-D-aspartate/D-glutamate deacylase